MSEPKKPRGAGDPFEGMDWDNALDDWDKSTGEPGQVSVPESFSKPPPPVATGERPSQSQIAAKPARPLYRPPPTAARSNANPPPPRPAQPVPTTPRQKQAPLPTPIATPSPFHQEEERAPETPRGHDDFEQEDSTVVAPVSRDLLEQLEKVSKQRPAAGSPAIPPRPQAAAQPPRPPIPPRRPAAPAPHEESETTSEHDAQEPAFEDPSVVTSAPDFLAKVRGIGEKAPEKGAEESPHADDQPVAEGEMFDPFKGLDLEPTVAESAKKQAISNAPGPRLLAPQKRKHSEFEETAIIDKNNLGKLPKLSSSDENKAMESSPPESDPFAAGSDPFAAPLPALDALAELAREEREQEGAEGAEEEDDRAEFEAVEAGEVELSSTDEEPVSEGLADLLEGEGRAAAPEVAPPSVPEAPALEGEERPASSYVENEVQQWRARVERVAADARNREKVAKARGLVVASELAAIAGDRAHAIELAEEAWEAAPGDVVAIRQLRQLFAAEGRWDDAAPLLESEAKGAPTPAAKAHAAIVAADAARLARAAPDEASKLYETAQRAAGGDLRPLVARALAALAAQKPLPPFKWPAGAEAIGEAFVRRAKEGEPVEDTQLAAFLEGVPAYAEGNDAAVAAPLDALADSATLGEGARWLRVALEAARPKMRAAALDRLKGLGDGRAALEGRLAIALDLGDAARATEAASVLAAAHPDSATEISLHALHALGGAKDADLGTLSSLVGEPGVVAVGRAIAIASAIDPPDAFAADDTLDAGARVAGRFLSGKPVEAELRARTSAGAQLGFTLSDALVGSSPRATLEALSPLVAWAPDAPIEPTFARVLAELADGDGDAARATAREAVALDPSALPAVHALIGLGDEAALPVAMAAAETTADDGRAAAAALTVALAALRAGDVELAKRACDLALTRAPDDSLAAYVSELRARRAGDVDGVVEAIRTRAKATQDPVARTANLVREIFLLLGGDLPTCIERASEAAQLMPQDATVRALYERIAGEGAQGRAEWRAEVASTLSGAARAETLLDAAREAERHDDLDAAEKLAAQAEEAGVGAEAMTLRHRVQSRGEGAARLSEELMDLAKRESDPIRQRETYEELADLDLYARGDAASAILWHRAIVETTPGHLPSLRRLEHMLIGEGREDDYEAIAADLARALPPESRDAHAEVAARLRLRRAETPWESVADLIQLAVERETPSLWATRSLDALARAKSDDKALLRACDLLLARSERPAEVAALATRAAEASFRLGDVERARGYLERALMADPQHPTALASLGELRRHAGDFRAAAEAVEQMAQTQVVSEHRLEDWHAAAVLWLDLVNDPVRGRNALERAAEIDLGYADVFERLVALAREAKENAILADLYAQRLQQLEDPQARAALQVEYAHVLVELGDRDAARSALSEALEVAPGNLEALKEGARLAEEAEDWPDLESYLLKLARSAENDDERIVYFRRLGAVYEGPYPDPHKAEATYRKILEHSEDDEIYKRLVDVYVRLGEGEQAVETHQERVRLAKDPITRRDRLIELATLLDETAGDPERALKALEQARAGDPADLVALGALAEFHTKHGHPELVTTALDGAADELRRKIHGDPGDVELMKQLERILELRGRHDAMRAVKAASYGVEQGEASLVGAEDAAGVPELDDLLCPAEITASMRALLAKAGDALEKSIPVDLRALKAAKLGTSNPPLKAKIDAVARGFGLPDPDVVISRAIPFLCMPVGAKPFQIIIGDGIVSTDDEVGRRYALYRAMKICNAHLAAFVRVPIADLKTYFAALLHHLHPEFPAPEIEAERLDEISKRLQRFIPRKDEAELKTLAAAVVAEGVPAVETIVAASIAWGDRVALLAVGDLAAALRGVAWTGGQKLPADDAGRREWLKSTPVARDLVAFAVSDLYLEARNRAGVGER